MPVLLLVKVTLVTAPQAESGVTIRVSVPPTFTLTGSLFTLIGHGGTGVGGGTVGRGVGGGIVDGGAKQVNDTAADTGPNGV